MRDRAAAERRADRIRAFRAELDAVRAAPVMPPITDEQAAAIAAHHDRLLASLAAAYDIDLTPDAERLSRGMQWASFFAAVALTAAIYSLVSRYWGRFDVPLQAVLLAAFPLTALIGVELAARRERTLYVASLFATVAYGTYWLAIGVLSAAVNIPVAPPWIWAGALFGFALALPYRFRLVLGAALVSLATAVAGSIFQAAGYPWTGIVEHLDLFTLAAFALVGLAPRLGQLDPAFAAVTRLVGFGAGLLGVLIMSSAGTTSLLPASASTSEAVYQVLMLAISVGLLAFGVRWRWTETVRLSAVALTVFLLIRYVDWFWEALPGYAFFFVLAAAAMMWLLVLRRLRTRLAARGNR